MKKKIKHMLIGSDAHKEVKKYCDENNLKMQGTVDKAILEGVRVMRLRDAERGAIL